MVKRNSFCCLSSAHDNPYRNIHDATLRRVVLGRARTTPGRDGKMGVMLHPSARSKGMPGKFCPR